MMMRRMLITAGWLWAGLVALYLSWSATTDTGLYHAANAWLNASFGGGGAMLTFALLFIALGIPGVVFATAVEYLWPGLTSLPDIRGPTTGWGMIFVVLGIAGVASVAAALLWVKSGEGPSLSDPVQVVDMATLGNGAPRTGHVRLAGGEIDQQRGLVKSEKEKVGWRHILYAPVIAASGPGEKEDAPVRFFFRREKLTQAELAVTPVFRGHAGILVRDGLPEDAIAQFKSRGISVASPHFLLDEAGSPEARQWFTGFLISLTIAGVALIVALVATINLLRGKPMRMIW